MHVHSKHHKNAWPGHVATCNQLRLVDMVVLSHYLQGFMTIPGGDFQDF